MDSAVNLEQRQSSHLINLISGAMAGLSVDVALYPLDTMTTRLQSQQGFYKTGGFNGVYKGLTPVLAGSIPNSALFFVSYEFIKETLQPHLHSNYAPFVHMIAASVSDVLACVVRVPMEIAKQRKQTYTGTQTRSSLSILIEAYRVEGLRHGVYRGFLSTVARDLPFSVVGMPTWEFLKYYVCEHNNGQINSFQSALCGAVAGGVGAAVTTPLDLAKTRIMLAEDGTVTRKMKIRPVLHSIYLESGFKGLFTGFVPRVLGYSLGGFMFFGAYEYSKVICINILENTL